jgi:hypothetical protein
MSYTPTKTLGKTLDLLANALAAMPAAHDLCDAQGTTPERTATTLGRICMGDGEDLPREVTTWSGAVVPFAPPLIFLGISANDETSPGLAAWINAVSLDIDILAASRPGDSRRDSGLRLADQASALLDGLRAASTAGTLIAQGLRLSRPPIRFPPNALQGLANHWWMQITLTFQKGHS